MARYADIDVLLEHLATNDEGGFRTAITQWLEMHQVEDVAPVIHARWVLYHDETNMTYGSYACTNCKTIQGLSKYRYCPYCGAKMDEEV